MTRHIFFVTEPNGKGKSLFTIPGQMLTSKTALKEGILTHGCEYLRKRFPVGTVFYTDSDQVRFRRGCYFVLTLHPLSLRDGTPLEENLFSSEILDEYRKLTSK